MKKLLINFHSLVGDGTKKEIIDLLSSSFDVEVSSKYDYYFAMETIYRNKESMKELFESEYTAIRIMICGEAIYPDMNLFDYAIWYNDREYMDADRIISIPYLFAQKGDLFDEISELDNSKKLVTPKQILCEKTEFCNFIYSNARSHEMRDNIYKKLSEYKRVDSLGTHLNNTENSNKRNDLDWRKKSIELKKPYKFSIAVENACMYGYTTEKIMSSMMANTIPIYWGNPKVNEEYNAKSFINVNDYNSLDEVVERIIEIDSNDQLYCDIIKQPWRTEAQIKKCYEYIENYYSNFMNIFAQTKYNASRRPKGTWANVLYKRFMIE